MAQVLLIAAPIIGIGALNALNSGDAIGELSDLHSELRNREALTEEDDISSGGSGTKT